MIPTDENRQPKRPVLAPPSLADDANLRWETQDLHYQIEACKVRVETSKRERDNANGTPRKLEPPPR